LTDLAAAEELLGNVHNFDERAQLAAMITEERRLLNDHIRSQKTS
jgi:hypothetical protein